MLRSPRPLTATLSALVSATVALGACAGTAAASEPYIRPGDELAVINTAHLHALVPKVAAEALKPMIARAEVVYVALAKDAGYTITRPLTLLVTDDVDSHNGFSTVTPLPIINVQLAPSLQGSSIFTGYNEFERTLVHELTHHMSNDRDPNAVRRTLSHIFGRILPNDLLSAALAYLSTPAHQTMPSFWHEGCAQWAETTYAQPGTVWSGRGRDSLSHMVWRLDAAAGGIPPVGDWRLSYQRWPFGSHAYIYGLAYLRYLDAAYGDRASVWQLIERQEHRWPFAFNGGAERILDKDHLTLIDEARAALQREQEESLRLLRQVPITTAKRLTADDSTLGAPAWQSDGRLFAALNGPYDLPGFVTVDRQGHTHSAGYSAFAMSEARSLSDGTLVFSESSAGTNPWARNRVNLVTPKGHLVTLPERRLLQPDARLLSKAKETAAHADVFSQYQYVAIRLRHDGSHDLVVGEAAVDDGWLSASADCGPLDHLTSEGLPWSPSFRPQHDELIWVETDAKGSRLVWAPLIAAHVEPMGDVATRVRRSATLGARTVLAEIPGRILHPAWDAKGENIFFCADHSGVPNAYRLDPAKPGELVPVTNTIGGVLACVPSPDGRELAIIDHDAHGPFLARLPNDPSTWPKSVPKIALAWPAPVAAIAGATKGTTPANAVKAEKAEAKAAAGDVAKDAPALPRFALPDDQGKPGELKASPYHGLAELRPLFWTPTTYPVPEGGYGIVGVMADPIFSHELIGAAGVGPFESSPVGFAGYVYSGSPIEIGVLGWQAERSFDKQIVDSTGQEYDYTEVRRSAELRLGRGMAGFSRRLQFFAAGGISEYRPVHAASKDYNGKTLVNLAPFSDVERYAELTLAYDSSTFFPTSFTHEDGTSFAINYRRSGFGGELHGERVLGLGTYVWSFLPEYGQQLVVAGAAGWSHGDRYLQGQYSVGGTFNVNSLPRGYNTSEAIGYYLAGGSIAWRTPLWRPFHGHSTTPFVSRQVVLETFFDAAHVSTDHVNGNGDWFRSVGGELHMSWVVWELLLNPGIGVAQQLDGDKNTRVLFSLDFLW